MKTEENIQKLKILKIWEILNTQTDEFNQITTAKLIEELAKIGITVERRTLYKDIKLLQKSGYKIENGQIGKSSSYYVKLHKFKLSEIKILADEVQASKFISEEQTKDFIEKLSELCGNNCSERLKNNHIRFNTVKIKNRNVFETIEILEKAIEYNKKIKFRYFEYTQFNIPKCRHNGMEYIEEPLEMVFDDGNYYLICYKENYENNIKTFRVDKIIDLSLKDENLSDKAMNMKNRESDLLFQTFRMYDGKVTDLTLSFPEDLIGVIYDKFGDRAKIRKFSEAGDDMYCAKVCLRISPTFWGWMLQFPKDMKIVKPEELKEEYIKWVRAALE